MRVHIYKLFICLTFLPLQVIAQDKGGKSERDVEYRRSAVLKAYRTNMKAKNYLEAKKTIDNAFSQHSEATADAHLYMYKMDALDQIVKAENRKIYLNSKPDTVSFFSNIYEMYETGLKCDSIEEAELATKRAEGKSAKSKLRSEIRNYMLSYRTNVLGAGKFFYNKKQYAEAFKYLDMYMQTKDAPVLTDSTVANPLADPDDRKNVSIIAVLSAYASSNYHGVMTYLKESLSDDNIQAQIIEIGYKSAAELKDTTSMQLLLEKGFEKYPEVEYFFMTLMKYYNNAEEYDRALATVTSMVKLYPDNRDYHFMKAKQHMLLKQYEQAVESLTRCVQIKADDADSYSALGNIYLLAAQDVYSRINVSVADPKYFDKKNAMQEYYKKACTCFELAKKFQEDKPELWLDGLREVYFKLNKGRELRSLEKYKK